MTYHFSKWEYSDWFQLSVLFNVRTHYLCLFSHIVCLDRCAWNCVPVLTDSRAMMTLCQVFSLEHRLLLFASHNLAENVCHLGDDVSKAECCHEVGLFMTDKHPAKPKVFVFTVKEGH